MRFAVFSELVRFIPIWLVLPYVSWAAKWFPSSSAIFLILHSGIMPAIGSGPAAIRRRLNSRLRWADRQLALNYVAMLAQSIHLHVHRRPALVVLEAYADLSRDDYQLDDETSDRTTLKAKLSRTLDGRSVASDAFVMALAIACHHDTERTGAAAVTVVEAYLSLSSDRLLRPDNDDRSSIPADTGEFIPRTLFVITAVGMLYGFRRVERARAILARWFDLTSEDLRDPIAMAARIRGKQPPLPSDVFDVVCGCLSTVFSRTFEPPDQLRLVETLLDIKPDQYDDPRTIAKGLRLIPREGKWVPRTMALLQALTFDHQYERSLVVFRGLLIDENNGAPADAAAAVEGITRLVERLPDFEKASVNGQLLHLLFGLGHHEELAIPYAEALFGLSATVYAHGPDAVVRALKANRPGFSPEESTELFTLLAGLMVDEPSRRDETRLLLDAYLWEVIDISTDRVPGAVNVCHLYWLWLDLTFNDTVDTPDNPSPVWSVALNRCRAIVRFVRATLAGWGETLADRRRLATELADVRRSLITAGWWLVRNAPSLAQRAAVQMEVLCWDVELGQRILFERVRFRDGDKASDQGTSDEDLKDGWSLGPDDEPSDPDRYSPDPDDAAPLGQFGTVSESILPRSIPTPSSGPPPVIQDDEFAKALRTGVDVPKLAATLGDRTVLLRAWFTPKNDLIWVAIQTNEQNARVLASGETTGGAAHGRLLRAVQWHDKILKLIWESPARSSDAMQSLAQEALPQLDDLSECLRGLEVEEGKFKAQRAILLETAAKHRSGPIVADWLEENIPLLPDNTDQRRKMIDDLKRFAALLKRLAYDRPVDLRDEVTAEFLTWAARVWNLAPLALELMAHFQHDLDLVVDVEGPLHAVPVAFLPVGPQGQRLMNLARSVRTSLSLFLAVPAEVNKNNDDIGDVVTVSWFATSDTNNAAVARGEWWLHAGQKIIAGHASVSGNRGLPRRRWRTAARSPAGCAAAIVRSVSDGRPIRTLTVCGHGTEEKSGVRLSSRGLDHAGPADTDCDSLWVGEGCDLKQVDLLLLISCSIGRPRQLSELPDVDGFVADLTAHGCRAALAARWPVHCLEAPQLGNMVAEEFCATDRQEGRADRAAALARARRKILECADGRKSTTKGLNTVAAFELYGLG